MLSILWIPVSLAYDTPARTNKASLGTSFDVVVYDASAGGVIAAVASARHGAHTALICSSWPSCYPAGGERVGGMSSGGLGQTDMGSCNDKIGGFAREFYRRNRARYSPNSTSSNSGGGTCRLPSLECNATFNLEPHIALSIFEAMLTEAGVTLIMGAQVDTVAFAASSSSSSSASPLPSIASIATVDKRVYSSRVWIDASYEGDLMAKAGVAWTAGREGTAKYGESLAGRRAGESSNEMSLAVNPYDGRGNVLPFVASTRSPAAVGEGDNLTQSYNFRLCVTNVASNMVPWAPPTG